MAHYLEDVHSESLGFTVSPSVRRMSRWRDADQRKPLLYAREQACPIEWGNSLLHEVIPSFLAFNQEDDLSRYSPTLVANAMLSMNIGQAGTWMPARVEKCGGVAHNIMTWAENDVKCVWFINQDRTQSVGGSIVGQLRTPLGSGTVLRCA